MKKWVQILIIITLCIKGNAQSYRSYTGLVLETRTQNPLSGAVITIKNTSDNFEINLLADKDGRFSIDSLAFETVSINVSFAGFKSLQSEKVLNNGFNNHDTIYLSPVEKVLENIELIAKKAYITNEINLVTVNVAASPLNAGSTIYEAITRTPGITEKSNSLQYLGQGVTIYINNRNANLNGDDLKNYLMSLPASAVEKIEIIPNPSAKYDANGSVVINLKLAKSKSLGTNGTLTFSPALGKWFQSQSGISLNHRSRNVNIYGGYNFSSGKKYNKTESGRMTSDKIGLFENNYSTSTNFIHSFRAGLDWEINKNSSAGFLVKGMTYLQNRRLSNLSSFGDSKTQSYPTSDLQSIGKSKNISPSVNFYFQTSFDSSRRQIQLNADYLKYKRDWTENFETNFFDPNGDENFTSYLRTFSPADIAIKSLTADYTHNLKLGGKFEAGIKAVNSINDNDILWETLTGSTWLTDEGKTNRFIYDETILAAYVNYLKKIKKWSFEAGLRAENTRTRGESVTMQQVDKQNYIGFFPNAIIGFKPTTNNIFSLAYKKSITRYGFNVVNPFIRYQSQYSYFQGNPDIMPTYENTFSLKHIFKQKLTSTFYYRNLKGMISMAYRTDSTNNIIISRYENLSSSTIMNLNLNYSFNLLKNKWSVNNMLYLARIKYSDPNILLNNNATNSFMYYQSNTFQLPKGFHLELTGYYISPIAVGTNTMKSQFVVNGGISKSVLKGKRGKLALNITDIFNSQISRYRFATYGVEGLSEDKAESRFVRLSFTWQFGNQKVSNTKVRKIGIENEKGRIDP